MPHFISTDAEVGRFPFHDSCHLPAMAEHLLSTLVGTGVVLFERDFVTRRRCHGLPANDVPAKEREERHR